MLDPWRDARARTDQAITGVRTKIRDLRANVRSVVVQIRAESQRHREESRTDDRCHRGKPTLA